MALLFFVVQCLNFPDSVRTHEPAGRAVIFMSVGSILPYFSFRFPVLSPRQPAANGSKSPRTLSLISLSVAPAPRKPRDVSPPIQPHQGSDLRLVRHNAVQQPRMREVRAILVDEDGLPVRIFRANDLRGEHCGKHRGQKDSRFHAQQTTPANYFKKNTSP